MARHSINKCVWSVSEVSINVNSARDVAEYCIKCTVLQPVPGNAEERERGRENYSQYMNDRDVLHGSISSTADDVGCDLPVTEPVSFHGLVTVSATEASMLLDPEYGMLYLQNSDMTSALDSLGANWSHICLSRTLNHGALWHIDFLRLRNILTYSLNYLLVTICFFFGDASVVVWWNCWNNSRYHTVQIALQDDESDAKSTDTHEVRWCSVLTCCERLFYFYFIFYVFVDVL